MLKRRTLLLLVSAIALLGGVLLFEGNRSLTTADGEADQSGEPTLSSDGQQDGELMFPFAEEDVETLTVERPADTVAFEKSEADIWQMTAPEEGVAEPGAIAFLLTQLTNPSTNTLTVPSDALSDFGLDNPTATVNLTANGSDYQLTVGTADFTGDQLYVQATEGTIKETTSEEATDASEVEIHLVSGGFDNAINRPTPDWLAAEEPDTSDEANLNEEADEALSEE